MKQRQGGFGLPIIIILLVFFAVVTIAALKVAVFKDKDRSSQPANVTEPAFADDSSSVNFLMGDFDTSNGAKDALKDTDMTLNVKECPVGKDLLYFGQGHDELQILGRQGNYCVFDYGGEVENPRWDHKLNTECKVPITFQQQLNVSANSGINYEPIAAFCKTK